jgi:hypothetical protein
MERLWSIGHPLIAQGILAHMKQIWNPRYFIDKYGKQYCSLVDCCSAKEDSTGSNIGSFFSMFGQYESRENKVWKLKVKLAYQYQ